MIGDNDNYIISDDFIVSDIIEYDMHEAGWSIIQNERLVPPEIMESLSKLDKHARHIEIGKLKYKIKGFQKELSRCFRKYRLMFIAANNLSESDIVSIKKDAIFVKKYCYNTDFGDNVIFAEKHSYSAFMKINRLEFYWGSDNVLDIKGISDANLELHKNHMMKFLHRMIYKIAFADNHECIRYIIKFMNDYKKYQLDAGYYRPFNSTPFYPMMIDGVEHPVEYISKDYLPMCDISYNYVNILVPILNIVNS